MPVFLSTKISDFTVLDLVGKWHSHNSRCKSCALIRKYIRFVYLLPARHALICSNQGILLSRNVVDNSCVGILSVRVVVSEGGIIYTIP